MPGFSGQGRVLIGTAMVQGGIRQPGLMRWIGNASEFKISMAESNAQRNESFSGLRNPLRRMTASTGASVMVKFDEFNADNLALVLRAAVTQVSAGSAVTNYTFPTGVKVGSTLALPAKNVTAVVVKDSTGSPVTLVAGTNYTLDAAHGAIEILSLGSLVQPFKVDYTPGAYTKVGAMNQPALELYVQLQGINTDDQSKVAVDVFRVKFGPTKDLSLITDTFADFEMSGDVLADTGRALSSADGQFFVTAQL